MHTRRPWWTAALLALAAGLCGEDQVQAAGKQPRRLPLRIAARAVAPESATHGYSEPLPPADPEHVPAGEAAPADAPLPDDGFVYATDEPLDLYEGCCNLVQSGCCNGGYGFEAGHHFGVRGGYGYGGMECCQRGCCPHPNFSYLWDNYGCENLGGHCGCGRIGCQHRGCQHCGSRQRGGCGCGGNCGCRTCRQHRSACRGCELFWTHR